MTLIMTMIMRTMTREGDSEYTFSFSEQKIIGWGWMDALTSDP